MEDESPTRGGEAMGGWGREAGDGQRLLPLGASWPAARLLTALLEGAALFRPSSAERRLAGWEAQWSVSQSSCSGLGAPLWRAAKPGSADRRQSSVWFSVW